MRKKSIKRSRRMKKKESQERARGTSSRETMKDRERGATGHVHPEYLYHNAGEICSEICFWHSSFWRMFIYLFLINRIREHNLYFVMILKMYLNLFFQVKKFLILWYWIFTATCKKWWKKDVGLRIIFREVLEWNWGFFWNKKKV